MGEIKEHSGDTPAVDTTQQEPVAKSDYKEPDLELMAEAMAWTAERAKSIPEEVYVNPKDFAIALFTTAYQFFKDAEEKYKGSKPYSMKAPEAMLESVREGNEQLELEKSGKIKNKKPFKIIFDEAKIKNDCAYSFVNMVLSEYISKNHSGPFFEVLRKVIASREARNFLQQEQIVPQEGSLSYESYINSHIVSKNRKLSKQEIAELKEKSVLQKEEIAKLDANLRVVHDFARNREGMELLKKLGIEDISDRALGHVVGSEVAQLINLIQY